MTERKKKSAGPIEQVDALLAEVPGWTLVPRSIVVRGDEEYFSRRVQDAVASRARELDYEVLVRDAGDGRDVVSDVATELATPPMFAPRQLFVLRGFDAQLRATARDQAPLAASVAAFLDRSEPERAVLLVAPSLRADNGIVKRADRVVAVRKLYDSPPPWNPDPMRTELATWLVRRSRELGVRLDPRSVLYVAAATGNDLGALDAQLERIRAMGPGDVRAAANWQAGASPFDAADHLVAGDLPRALADLTGLFAAGMKQKDGSRLVDAAGLSAILLSQLGRTVRQGLAIAEAHEAGESPEHALEAAGVTGNAVGPWRTRMNARPRSREWRRMLDDVGALEIDARSTGVDVGVEHFTALAIRWRARGVGVRS
ncbi:MAG: hypothetical protein R3F34_07110 [Planctomycetota bacterium]